MCRFATCYLQHYACFECRLTRHGSRFQKPDCPECGRLMRNMGLNFRAPKRSDRNQWRKVQRLFELGFAYHSCGCSGAGFRPRRLSEIDDFLREVEEAKGAELVASRRAEQEQEWASLRKGKQWRQKQGKNQNRVQA